MKQSKVLKNYVQKLANNWQILFLLDFDAVIRGAQTTYICS